MCKTPEGYYSVSVGINISNCIKMIMQIRDRTDIIRRILDIANGAEGVTKVKIMYKAFLSYKQIKEYIALLTERDLLRYDSITKTYKTTEKGLRLLQFCNELDEMMKKAS
jgi:predicted transcriptional regulator